MAPAFADNLRPEIYVCLLKNPHREIQDIALKILCALTSWGNEELTAKLRANKMIEMLFLQLQVSVISLLIKKINM